MEDLFLSADWIIVRRDHRPHWRILLMRQDSDLRLLQEQCPLLQDRQRPDQDLLFARPVMALHLLLGHIR